MISTIILNWNRAALLRKTVESYLETIKGRFRMLFWGIVVLQAAIVALVTACSISPTSAQTVENTPSVTPYRPSVSTPAALSAPGWLELEVGGYCRQLGEIDVDERPRHRGVESGHVAAHSPSPTSAT
jgi:hypothetical protein